MSKNMEDIISKLKAPFPFNEIKCKIQVTKADKTSGLVVFYINSRAIQNRLDEAVGSLNWRNEYLPWQEKAQICGISIFDEARNNWVTKYDGAENTDYEPIKGGLSDSFKRAAVIWGLGRYLYDIDGVWAEIEQKGKNFSIKNSEKAKLEAHYNKALKKTEAGNPSSNNKPTPKPTDDTGGNSGSDQSYGKPSHSQPADTNAVYFKVKSVSETETGIRLKLIGKGGI